METPARLSSAPGEVSAYMKANIVEASDPLSMVQQTLARMQQPTSQVVADPRVKKEEAPVEVKTAVDEILSPSFADKSDSILITKPAPVEVTTADNKVEPVAPLEDKVDENPLLAEVKVKKGPEESIKDLRKKSNEYKTQLEERDLRLAELQQQIDSYNTGEAVPEKVAELSTKLEEVEKEKTKYENLHALKLSKEYNEKYIDSAEAVREEARELAKEYGVNPSVFDQAWGIESKRDLNSFLRKHFNDDVGAFEARELLTKLKTINQEASLAEQEPAQKLQELRAEYAQQEQQQAITRVNSIKQNAKSAWNESLNTLRESGQYPEFEVTGDIERDKVTKPLIEAASTEYGRFVTMMGNLGMKELPKEAAAILAKRFLLSQVTPLTAASRAAYYQENQDVINTSKRDNAMKRPPIGAGTVNSSGPGNPRPKSATEAADMLIDKVLTRR